MAQLKFLSRRSFLKAGILLSVAPWISHFIKIGSIQNQKRIYIAPDDHTDYFWTAGEDTYRRAFLEMIDYYLQQADATQGNPSDFQSRWNCDGSYWIWIFEKNRTPEQFSQLIDRVRDGHINFPLNALVVCLGGAPVEAVLRGMYYAGSLERRFDFRVRIAIAMENQTLPFGLPALWYGAGARYSWKGICGCDTQLDRAWDRQHDIYWATGPDNSQILMKWNSMLGDMAGVNYPNQGMGGYAESRNPSAVVNYVDSDPDFTARYPYEVIGAFGIGWDDLQTLTNEFVITAQSMSNENRRVIVSNQKDFFEDFESEYGQAIPAIGCTFGNEWDLYCATLADVSANVKRSIEKLRGAEALATLVIQKNPNFMNGRETARSLAWMDLGLFWEHNFGMVNPPSGLVNQRIAWQKRLASEIEAYVDNLHNDAITTLGNMIVKSGTNLRFFAFNPLSWSRGGVAEIPYTNLNPVHVVDITNDEEVPSQIIIVNGQRFLRILARNVPPVGYKVYEVRSGIGQYFSDAASINENIIENNYFRITVADRGAISSLIDKTRANREFIQLIDNRTFNDLGPGSGSMQIESLGPVSATILINSNNPLTHTTRITLVRDSNTIYLHNEINQNFNSVYTWAFGLNLDNPDVWHEEVGAIIRAKTISQGGQYSDRVENTRYDWLTLNHFVDISNLNDGITISNMDCYFMKLGRSLRNSLDTTTPQINILAGGRVANGENGLPEQGGDSNFLQRFGIKTHDAFDPADSMRFALEHQNPLISGQVTGGDLYPENFYQFLSISNPNIILWALKPADDGIGTIARVWNTLNSSQTFSLSSSNVDLESVQYTSHIETPISQIPLSNGLLIDNLTAQQLKTYLILFKQGTPEPPATPTRVATATSTPTFVPTPLPNEKKQFLPCVRR